MLNKVEVEGKVLSVWVSKKGGLIMKLAVTHNHRIGDSIVTVESILRPIFNDTKRIETVDVMAGDKVRVIGHLYLNHTISATGCTHDTLQLYADDIEIISFAKGSI